MDNIKKEIIHSLDSIQDLLDKIPRDKFFDEKITSMFSVENVLSNHSLLKKTMSGFFEEDKSEYFPVAALLSINELLEQIIISINKSNASPDLIDLRLAVIKQLDSLYATCLTYGIISFGFHQKITNEVLEETRGIHKRYLKHLRKAETGLDDLLEKLSKKFEDFSLPIKEEMSSMQGTVSALSFETQKKIEELEKESLSLQAEAKTIQAAYEKISSQATAMDDAIESIKQNSVDATEEKNVIALTHKEATTLLESIKSSKVSIKEEIDGITEFYSEIENYQTKINEIKKEANDKYNKLIAEFENSLLTQSAKSNEIIEKNIKQQSEIDIHLSRALGASLFKAFDIRRSDLTFGKNLWVILLVVFVLIGVGLTLWIAHDLAGGVTTAFYLKLSAYVPIAFFIVFSAKQYSNERRTEEEYAFKSAISISLEPYRNLLTQIAKSQSEDEANFVRKLILEIFDNPVKRIYVNANDHDSKNSDNNFTQLKSILHDLKDKFAPEDVKSYNQLLDSIQDLINGEKK